MITCRAGNVEYGDLTDQQRAAVLNNLAAGLMDTSMMRQVGLPSRLPWRVTVILQ